ncbi:unnamed protein product [Diamesa serratosioi]
MSANDHNAGDSSTQSTLSATEPKRKVSILTDPPGERGQDNLGYEGPKRKISQQSDHSDGAPSRRKSILHNPIKDQMAYQPPEPIQQQPTSYAQNPSIIPHLQSIYDAKTNGDSRTKKHSTTESLYSRHSRKHNPDDEGGIKGSWIHALCMRCRVQYKTPSWQPKHWQKVCPYPICPSYRQFARLVSIILIGVLIWAVAYAIIGKSAAPGGQLFSLVTLTVAANFGGWLMGLTTLPRLIGMLLTGILMQNVGAVNIDGIKDVTAQLRKFALVIILTRAGLEMDPEAFKKIWVTILKLGLVPWTVEAGVNCVLSHYLLDLPWMWALLLGSIIAAVSPAVVVPCLFRLRTKGYGVAKGIPTLIIAVAGIDDAASVAIFGIISSLMFATGGLTFQISQAPVCILGGLGFGIFWGNLSRVIPEKGDAYVVPIRCLMLLGGGLLAVFGSELLHFEGAGPLAVVFAAFSSSYYWCKQGWELEDNPVATAFEIFWMIFEPILFGITGASVKIAELDPHVVSMGLVILSSGVILRILATISIAFGDKLNVKEKIFVSLSWMAKATVQAALGPVALKHLTADDPQRKYAEIVLMICILSIVLTAPMGAILISITGQKLLTKTTQPQITEGWRRSHRPSLRDISIIDEEEEKDEIERDPEMGPDKNTLANTQSNLRIQPPTFTITK